MENYKRARLRSRIAKDQNGRCFYCHLQLRDDLTLEHLKARVLGGGNNFGNLRVAHSKCNSSVGHLPVEEKLRLAKIGEILGSDAFFLEIAQIRKKRPQPDQVKMMADHKRQLRADWRLKNGRRYKSSPGLLRAGAGAA